MDYNELSKLFPSRFSVAMFIVLAVWSLIWKGIALWKAAHKESRSWYIALLVLNTAGILDILYIYFFSERAEKPESDGEGL